MKTDTCKADSRTFLDKCLPALLLGVSAGYCHTALVDETEMIRNQMRKHNRLEMVAFYSKPWAIPPPKNSDSM